ncbi:glycerophosphoinositol inositolphosphodiesterase GDPD2 isoform X2 [Salarias fasciatus]|uniref:GP-PDE domain-containing protein n=1 Tax=Salarias fasciatus TaxID=181472 RepID=A0A672ICF2_SALFA|nr:glycerophosphoinositol inositolphosphodiesterase GDPD2 isoform X2 [Salarias fasciatus]
MSQNCCRVCSRGLYSCHWRNDSPRERKNACPWFSVISVVSLLSLSWMYICLVAFNDQDDVNWKGFETLKLWVNWFMVLIIISAVLTSYCVLLLIFALLQVALGERLDLHCLHKVFLFLGVAFIISCVTAVSHMWQEEWPAVLLSLQATAPFLQFGAAGALTLLSLFVFRSFHKAKKGSKILIAGMFLVVSAAIFLCPLAITSPCLIDEEELPAKPKLIGHRGAPMLAPENTMMSFNRSIACGVTTFETDVQLSKDRIPFLMHDHEKGFLLRTTNVKEKFPNKTLSISADLTLEELQSLNAGEWFLKTDPFHSVSGLSEEEKEMARVQTIPSLLKLLDLANEHNISVFFDLYRSKQDNSTVDKVNDTVDTVDAILNSSIDPSLVFWLPSENREYVNLTAPGFTQIYNNESEMRNRGGKHLNLKYSNLSTGKIRDLRRENISVNLWVVNERWLFSLLWCAGASSVTTNSCNLLKNVHRPDWTMAPQKYRAIWVSVDVASAVIMIILYIFQWKTHCLCHRGEVERHSPAVWNEKELYPFLPTNTPFSPQN